MPKSTTILNNFTAGELSPVMAARVDFAKYQNGCEILENFYAIPQGGAAKRPGTHFVAEVKNSSKKVRLIPFEFSTAQAYILEFGDYYIRFYMDDGQIMSAGSPYEIASPYAEADLAGIACNAQSADVLYLAHPNYAPRKLSRAGHTDWTLTEINFQPPPTKEVPIQPAATLTLGATTGTSVTFTASASVFLAGDVNRQITSGAGRAIIIAYVSGTEVTCEILDAFSSTGPIASGSWSMTGSPNAALTPDKKSPVGAQATLTSTTDLFRSADVSKYIYINDGLVQITQVVSATKVKAEILTALTSTTASEGWTLESPAWSASLGYPAAVSFDEQRLIWAGSPSYPMTAWGSVIADYENHTRGANDDNAFEYTLAANQVSVIRWMELGKMLFMGTAGGVWQMGSTSLMSPITPTNVFVRRASEKFCDAIHPIVTAEAMLFVQQAGAGTEEGRKVRELVYNIQQDGYATPDLTILSGHITRGGINALVYQPEPYQMIYCPRNDGVLPVLTYARDQEVVAWQRFVTDGEVESVAQIPGNGQGEIWLAVKRTINGATRRYIEYLAPFDWGDDQEDCFFVDCGLTYSGSAATTISGLDHLEGETVNILADGAKHPQRVVSSGAITLQSAASKVHVGLPYTSKLKNMRIEAGSASGTAQGKPKRIGPLFLRLYQSMGGKIGPDENHLETLQFRTSTDAMDTAVPLFTGDKQVSFPGGWSRDGQILIVHDDPLPFTVLGIIADVQTTDR